MSPSHDPLRDVEVENDHNVYILGAGFSAEAGLPVIANFLNVMRDSYEWLAGEHRVREADAVKKILAFRMQAASAALRVRLDPDNIEHLYSLVSASGEGGLAEEMRLAIAATLDYAQRHGSPSPIYLRVPGESLPPAAWVSPVPRQRKEVVDYYELHPHVYYVGVMLGVWRALSHGGDPTSPRRSRDTIISLNYDLLVERALDALGVGCSYGFHHRVADERTVKPHGDRHVCLYKLHGSINWADTKSVTEADAETPDEVAEITLRDSYDDLRERDEVPVIVPPTWNKRFAGQLQLQWTHAVDALRTATRIILLGFSIPPTDVHFKYLLASGLQHNISLRRILIVNKAGGSPAFMRTVRRLLRAREIVDGLEESITMRSFFLGAAACGDTMSRGLGRKVGMYDERSF